MSLKRVRPSAEGKPQHTLLTVLLHIYRMTHGDLARKLKCSRQAVNHWAAGIDKPSPENGKKLEKFFGKSVAALLAPANVDGRDVVVLYSPKTHVACPNCQHQVRVL